MRAHQLNESGLIINTVEVDIDGWLSIPNLIDASIGGGIGDSVINGKLHLASNEPSIPQAVPRKNGLLVLHQHGLLSHIRELIDAMPEPQRTEASIQLEDSEFYVRSDQFVQMLGVMAGLDSDGIDQLFIEAAALP